MLCSAIAVKLKDENFMQRNFKVTLTNVDYFSTYFHKYFQDPKLNTVSVASMMLEWSLMT
jgi:hypothetical protein